MKKLYISLVILCLSLTGFSQVRMTMVDPANHQIQIKNFGMMAVDISAYRLCALFDYQTLNQAPVTFVEGDFNLSSNESVTLSWNNDGGAGFLTVASDVGLYLPGTNGGAFGSATNMVDFMQYGAGGQGREGVAVTAGIWTAGQFLDTSTGPWMYTGNGTQNGMMFWTTVVVGVPGCLDIEACNYDTSATEDDGSCIYPGCTEMDACNFDSNAGCSDNSCLYPGCMDILACNYNEAAGCDDGSCIFADGCVDVTACNYDSLATCDDGSCTFPDGCTDSTACNYDTLATCDDGSCLTIDACGECGGTGVPGCTDSTACNYDTLATCDDGACTFPDGCTDPTACNYDTLATCDDGSCLTIDACGDCGGTGVPGCTDPTACNYDSLATCDADCVYPAFDFITCNGSCVNDVDSSGVCDEFEILSCSDSLAYNFNSNDTLEADDTCYYAGCTDVSACNYSPNASIEDESCVYPGCGDTLACNYDANAGCPDSCIFALPLYTCDGICINDGDLDGICDENETVVGCTDSLACNFDQTALEDNGSCVYPGCNDIGACNYDTLAGCDDGTCLYPAFDFIDCSGSCLNDSNLNQVCDELEIGGCTDMDACNFDPADSIATDDVCYYPGCTDILACNYTDTAACNDNSCTYAGCTDISACNYDQAAGCDDGSCVAADLYYDCAGVCLNDIDADDICDELETAGCMDSMACNYNAFVTQDDSSCLSIDACGICGGSSIAGCTDIDACNYNEAAICDDGSCLQLDGCGVCGGNGVPGCTEMNACNYDMTATCNNGSCIFPGCIAPLACNFDASAGCDDGSCTFGGCTDSVACNYDASAACSYSTCIYSGDTLIEFENFDAMIVGDGVAAQNSFWNTWTGNIAGEDGYVSDVTAFSGTNSGEINGMATDLILPILPSGPITSGIVEASFKMNVTDAGGYFNILHQWSATGATYEWACDVFVGGNGQVSAVTGSLTTLGPIVEVGSWFDVKVIADLNTDNGYIFINNQPVSFWQWSLNNADGTQGTNQIAAIDFFGTNDAGGEGLYYIDDVKVTHYIEGLDCGTVTGASEITNFFAPVVYPNPSNGIYQVVMGEKEEIKQLEAFELTGRRVFLAMPNSSNAVADLTSLPAGSYLLKITGDDQTHSVMVQKY